MYSGLITLILPCYRAEAFIARMIDCVIAQEYEHWELLIISNGSGQEAQLEIINRYQQQDNRIRSISVPESGLSNARNVGIAHAKGDYFTFVDADDEIAPDHLTLFASVVDDGSELIIGGYTLYRPKEDDRDAKPLYNFDSKTADAGMKDAWLKFIQMEDSRASASWNKLHRTDLIRSLDLKYSCEYSTYEDTDFYLALIPHISRLQCIPMSGYQYICADESSIQSKWHPDLELIFQALARRRQVVQHLIGMDECLEREEGIRQRFMEVYWLVCNFFKKGCPLSFFQKRKEVARLISDPVFLTSVSLQDTSQHNGLLKLFDFAIATKSPAFVTLFFAAQYAVKRILGPWRGYIISILRRS